MGKAIGIDLGTTNSVACYFDGHQTRVLLNSHHEELTPSVVGYESFDEGDGELRVGRDAVNQARLYPQDTIFSVKRLMGRRFADERVQRWRQKVSYPILETTEPDKGLAAVMMGRKQYLPEEVSALLLREIKRYSEAALGAEVSHAVITVPAYFGEPERAATRAAGLRAGLVVKSLLPEPTAAAIAFGHVPQGGDDGQVLLVYDLGGGTFDISIISLVESDYNVMRIGGDQFLGGDDFDAEIVAMILRHVRDKYSVDLSADGRFLVVAKAAAEAAKKSLSSPGTEYASIILPEAARAGGKDINVKMKVTRQEFEDAIRPRVEHSRKLVLETLADQGLTPELVSDVLLVGGSTAVPLVQRTLAEVFGESKIRRRVNPMHCVAVGAAILAQRMRGIACPRCEAVCDEALAACPRPECGASLAAARAVLEGMEVSDITANNFGIQAVAGTDSLAFTVLVPKSERLPMQEPKRKTFYTTEDGQSHIRVPVYEGLGETVTQNTYIGVIEYDLPRELPRGHPIHVEFRLDRQSIVNVTIEVEGLGHRREETLRRGAAPPPDPDEGPLIEDDGEEIDERQKLLANLEVRVTWAGHFLKAYDRILTPPQKARLNQAVGEAQQVLDAEDVDTADRAWRNLEALMSTCGTAFVIEHARLTARAVDEDTAARLNQLADELQGYAEKGDVAAVNRLRDPLAGLIRQAHQKLDTIKDIGDEVSYGGLLSQGQGSTGD